MGVKRRPVVQVVNRGTGCGAQRVSVHGSRRSQPVHPAVMGQLIAFVRTRRRGGGAGGRQSQGAEGGEERSRSRERAKWGRNRRDERGRKPREGEREE